MATPQYWQKATQELAERDPVLRELTARRGGMTPELLCAAHHARLRACGLSGQKAGYVLDLAAHFANGTLDPAHWHDLDDQALIAQLTRVKGIGRWTAEMFLIFYLARPDVLPIADVGLQRAMRVQYNKGKPLTPTKMVRIGKTWAPWRSVATWYLWRSLEALPVE